MRVEDLATDLKPHVGTDLRMKETVKMLAYVR
jgi:hypothetical protein